MNGVRRFFAASNATTSSSLPSSTPTEPTADPGTSPPKPPPLQTILPLEIGGKQMYPVVSETKFPVQASSPPSSPRTTTAGLFLRKDGPASPRRKPVNPLTSSETKALPLRPPSISTSPSSTLSQEVTSSTTPSSAANSGGSSRKPVPQQVGSLSQQASSTLSNYDKQAAAPMDTRNDLLMSLLSSEAIVDSRGYEILPHEEVEELKREQQLLSSRLVAMRKKVALETKIRDAALNLQKLQTVKRLSKQTSEQVDVGNRKADAAAKELSRLQERASDVDRKLLEHRAGVLSFSLRDLEAKMSSQTINGDVREDATRSRITSPELGSPTSSVTSMSTRAKFDGAHLFAGHADAVIPGLSRKAVSSAQIAALEEKFKNAEDAIAVAESKRTELEERIKLLQLEKSDIEANLNFDLQIAKKTISKLEQNIAGMRNADRDREEWYRQRQVLEEELQSRTSSMEELEQRVHALEAAETRNNDLERIMDTKDEEIRRLQDNVERERENWEDERNRLEQEKRMEVDRIQEKIMNYEIVTKQLDAGRDALRSVVRSQRVPTSPSDNTLPSLATSLAAHMTAMSARIEQSEREHTELDTLRRKYEEDVRNGLEIRERLGREVEEARREREDARKEARLLEVRLKEESERVAELTNARVSTPAQTEKPEEYTKVLTTLRGLWNILPSVEARVSKLGKSNTLAPGSPGLTSLSDLDVRALKSLYDPRTGFNSPRVSGDFSIDEFVTRVQALVADDRALVERLLRFAQSHDLLRNNAARAQKLAQESHKGLEMYQVQVKALEERNATLDRKQLSMLDEINVLQQRVNEAVQEKRELEAKVAEQVETVHGLTEANNKLSARALAFAEEAAAVPGALKAKLESQLSEVRAKLEETEDEIERMRNSESTQRVALLDELNSLQQENGKLRDQLRAKK